MGGVTWSIGKKAPGLGVLSDNEHGRQTSLHRHVSEPFSVKKKHRIPIYEESVRMASDHGGKDIVELFRT